MGKKKLNELVDEKVKLPPIYKMLNCSTLKVTINYYLYKMRWFFRLIFHLTIIIHLIHILNILTYKLSQIFIYFHSHSKFSISNFLLFH